jgi:SpoIIAA-like
MIERLDSPDTVLAMKAVGKVSKDDFESVVDPAAHEMLERLGELRFVYVLGDEFEGYSFGAGWEDAKLGLGHLTKWKRFAVVTNKDWVHHMVGAFGWMMPGEMKLFDVAETDAAITWAAG